MRRLKPFVYGLAVAAVAGAACFGLQAVALRQPHEGDLVAARAVAQLTRYRVVSGVAHLAGRRPVATTCVHAMHRFPGGGRRWAALVLAGRFRLAEAAGHVRSLAPLDPGDAREAAALFSLAACPHFFSRRLVQGFVRNRRFHLRETTFRGRPVYEMPFHVGESTVVLYVTREAAEPVGARLSGPTSGWSALTIHVGDAATSLRADALRRLR